jgi:hypothetical protein
MKICTIPGCGKEYRARGLCSGHYYHWHKENGGPFRRTLKDRLFAKVQADDETGCWNWIGAKAGDGYGKIKIGSAYVPSHRAMFELLAGPIPAGLVIDHLCRNTACCNPGHLEPVTHLENMRRGIRAGRPECINGHPFTPENSYFPPNGRRQCRACRTASAARRRERSA